MVLGLRRKYFKMERDSKVTTVENNIRKIVKTKTDQQHALNLHVYPWVYKWTKEELYRIFYLEPIDTLKST